MKTERHISLEHLHLLSPKSNTYLFFYVLVCKLCFVGPDWTTILFVFFCFFVFFFNWPGQWENLFLFCWPHHLEKSFLICKTGPIQISNTRNKRTKKWGISHSLTSLRGKPRDFFGQIKLHETHTIQMLLWKIFGFLSSVLLLL